MALFPALALSVVAALGAARAAPLASLDQQQGAVPQPALQIPAARNLSHSIAAVADGDTAWEKDTHRGRRDAADFAAAWDGIGPRPSDLGSGRSSRIEPLFADEPRFVLLERRETGNLGAVGPAAMYDANDPFWVARGRRRGDGASSGSSFEEPFWAARGRRRLWPQLRAVAAGADASVEEPFWAARGRRVPSGEHTWTRTQRAVAETSGARWRRRQLESVEEPFWAARGRRAPRESLSVEEPFWAARGKKGVQAFQDLPSIVHVRGGNVELDPMWAAQVILAASPVKSHGDLLSKVRARGASAELDPFWAARGKRGGAAAEDADENADDEFFWNALERRSALAGR